MTDQPQQLQFYYIRMKSDEQALDQMYYSVLTIVRTACGYPW